MFDRIANLDERIRGYMAKQAEDQLAARRKAIGEDLRSRLTSNPESVYKKIESALGQGGDGVPGMNAEYIAAMKADPRGARSQMMLDSAIEASARANPGYRMRQALAGESAGDRAQQVLAYGGLAGGGVAGLTAAGQGLMALMDYLNQGMAAQEEREQPLA